MTGQDRTISARIEIMRLLLVWGIVVLHTPPYVPLEEVPREPFALFKAFFQDALFRLGVPVLSAISGYLLFAAGQDRRPAALLRKKLGSLAVPFLLWNLPLAAALFAFQARGAFRSVTPDLTEAGAWAWADALFALAGEPVNYPLAFLRDLLLCALAAAALSPVFRRAPLATFSVVALVALWDLEGPLLLRGDVAAPFFFGGVVACRGLDPRVLDRHAPVLLLALLAACVLVVATAEPGLLVWLRLAGVVCLWPASGLLVRLPFAPAMVRLAGTSFWVFCSHAPILWALWIAWQAVLPEGPYPLFWALAPAATILLSLALHRATARLLPALAAVLAGGRAPRVPVPAR